MENYNKKLNIEQRGRLIMKITQCVVFASTFVTFAFSLGIAGNNDLDVPTPTWVYVVLAISMITSFASLFYLEFVKSRLLEIRKRKAMRKSIERYISEY